MPTKSFSGAFIALHERRFKPWLSLMRAYIQRPSMRSFEVVEVEMNVGYVAQMFSNGDFAVWDKEVRQLRMCRLSSAATAPDFVPSVGLEVSFVLLDGVITEIRRKNGSRLTLDGGSESIHFAQPTNSMVNV